MTLKELSDLISRGESETLEFKKTTGGMVSGLQTLCGMLNGRGGCVLFGVTPDGQPAGQGVSDSTLREISQALSHLQPSVRPHIEVIPIAPPLSVVRVHVEPGMEGPYSFRGRCYVRTGSSTREMTGEEVNRILLERLLGDERWENQGLQDWTPADLDEARIRQCFEKALSAGRMTHPGTVTPRDILRKWGLLREGKLLRASAVLFGKADILRERLPQCRLKFARFSGTDRSQIADNRLFHGNSLELLELADRLLRETLPVAGRIEPNLFERKDDPVYPPVALREALANAFCHRDYSLHGNGVAIAVYDDRLEIVSDGQLHFGLTVEMLGVPHESRPWNPLIAGVFHDIGLIEQWGRGTLRIMELSERAGLPRPLFFEQSGCLSVTFSAQKYVPPNRVANDLSEGQRKLLWVVNQARTGISLAEISQSVGEDMPVRKIKAELAYLKALKLVSINGHGRGAKWTIVSH